MKSCEFKTSEASTKSWFRTRKLLDNHLNIPEGQLQNFREANTKFSKEVNEKHNIPGRLFAEEAGSKKAVPNIEMFRKVDAATGLFYKENEYLRNSSFEQKSEHKNDEDFYAEEGESFSNFSSINIDENNQYVLDWEHDVTNDKDVYITDVELERIKANKKMC